MNMCTYGRGHTCALGTIIGGCSVDRRRPVFLGYVIGGNQSTTLIDEKTASYGLFSRGIMMGITLNERGVGFT